MKILGIDFTSSPSRRKPITAVHCDLAGSVLQAVEVQRLVDFTQFESLLALPGPWIAGLDLPFGQSRRLIMDLCWPGDWAGYVGLVGGMSRAHFVELLEDYKRDREAGDKEHRRQVDVEAGSISPQKLYGTPVGKMFFEGAPRILRSEASVIPMRINGSDRIIVEAYPALIARLLIGRASYKNDTRAKQTPELTEARHTIIRKLDSPSLRSRYGITVSYSREFRTAWIEDHSADELDAFLCAIQAAWAWHQRDRNFGCPRDVDRDEGWIADPLLAE